MTDSARASSAQAPAPFRSVLIVLGVCGLGFLARDRYLGTSVTMLPDTQFTGYSADFVAKFYTAIANGRAGLSGVRLYGWTGVTLDAVFPVTIAMLIVLGFRRVFRFVPWPMLAAVPALFVLADWGENLSLARIAWGFAPPTLTPAQTALVRTASLLTQVKWTLLGTALLALALGALTRRTASTPEV